MYYQFQDRYNGDFSTLCTVLWCSDVTGNGYCHTHIAGDGTLCGNKKVLINHSTLYEKEKCVRKN
jgi:hypothetical protein